MQGRCEPGEVERGRARREPCSSESGEVRGPDVCEGRSRRGARGSSPVLESVGRCTRARVDQERRHKARTKGVGGTEPRHVQGESREGGRCGDSKSAKGVERGGVRRSEEVRRPEVRRQVKRKGARREPRSRECREVRGLDAHEELEEEGQCVNSALEVVGRWGEGTRGQAQKWEVSKDQGMWRGGGCVP